MFNLEILGKPCISGLLLENGFQTDFGFTIPTSQKFLISVLLHSVAKRSYFENFSMEDPVGSNMASLKPLSAVTFTKRQIKKDENKLDLG